MKAEMIKMYVILWVALFSVTAYAWPWDKPTFNDDAIAVQAMAISNDVWAVDKQDVFDRFSKKNGWKVEWYLFYKDSNGDLFELPCTIQGFEQRMKIEQSGKVLEAVQSWKVKGKIWHVTKEQEKALFLSIIYENPPVKISDFCPVRICKRVR